MIAPMSDALGSEELNTNIRCWKCNKIFPWNIDLHTTNGKVVPEGSPDSDSLIINCKLCGTDVKIWVTNLKTYPVPIF